MVRLTLLSGRLWSGWPLLLGVLFALSCIYNRPDPPAVPTGPDSVEVDWPHSFKTWTFGPDSGPAHIRFDWGDGGISPWLMMGDTAECSHSWSQSGVYRVRAQAHDNRSELSEWSAPRTVTAIVPSYPFRLVDSVLVADEELLAEIEVLPGGEFVYVTSEWDASLRVVRTADLQVVAGIPFYAGWWGGTGGGRLVSSPDGEYVYATYYRGDYLAAVRTADEVVVDSLPLGGEDMTSIAISPDGHRLFVAIGDDTGYILAVRLPDLLVEDTIFIPDMSVYITSMRASPDGTRLYAANPADACVLSIRLMDHAIEWQAPSDLADGPGALVLHPTGNPLYVLNEEWIWVHESGTGSIIDSMEFTPFWNADIAPDGSRLYVTCGGLDSNGGVAVVQTPDNEVRRIIDMPHHVYDVAPSPDGQKLYVAGENGKLYVLGR